MGQEEVLEIFTKNKDKWLKSTDIVKKLKKKSNGLVLVSLNKLRRYGFIYRRKTQRRHPTLKYRINMYMFKLVPEGYTTELYDFENDKLVEKK